MNLGEREKNFRQHRVAEETRRQVESLLTSDTDFTDVLENLVQGQISAGLSIGSGTQPGVRCGLYRLIKCLGRGGMAEVWLGERSDGLLKRQVAVKLPHAGLHGPEFAFRCESERDILAGLAHRGIARLYDAGVDDLQRPFLVLEFVPGVAIDQYCDARRATIHDRVTLFLQVLEAVQYAHRLLTATT